MITFWTLALIMLVVALLWVVPPLVGIDLVARLGLRKPDLDTPKQALAALEAELRAGAIDEATYEQTRQRIGAQLVDAVAGAKRSEPSPAAPRAKWTALVVSLFVPALCVYLYLQIGSPDSLSTQTIPAAMAAGQAPGSVDEMVGTLAAKLEANPDDPRGWLMLGRSYFVLERYREAREAYARAHALIGDEPNLLVDFAEASALASDNRLEGEPDRLITRALEIEPSNQKGLWLAGFSALQRGDNATAVTRWQTLLASLPPNSEQISVITEMIDRAGGNAASGQVPTEKTASDGEASSAARDETADGPVLMVSVELDPNLAGQVSGEDTLFIFAKAVSGPPMPLAIQRMTANALPLTVRLDDTMSMLPAFKLSGFPEVTVGARVSRSGVATAQSGDLQGQVSPVPVSGTQSVQIVIGEVVP